MHPGRNAYGRTSQLYPGERELQGGAEDHSLAQLGSSRHSAANTATLIQLI